MAMAKFPVLELSGTPYEIGYGHGKMAREQIVKNIENYKKIFYASAKVSWEEAQERAMPFADEIKRYDEDIYEEIRGIADGAGISFLEAVTLNSRSEIMFQAGASDGCTSLGITAPKTSDGHTYIAQTWDWMASQRETMIILKIRQKRPKPDIFCITEAGILTKPGFNSEGVGVCLNALMTDVRTIGVPLHAVLRGILNARTLTGAFNAIVRSKIAGSANFLLGYGGNQVADVEVYPDGFDILYPQNDYLTHGNHILSPLLAAIDTGKYKFPDSFMRNGRADRLLRDQQKVKVSDIKEILRDHTGYPYSICRHGDESIVPEARFITVMSFIMDLTKKELLLCQENPCEGEYERYTL